MLSNKNQRVQCVHSAMLGGDRGVLKMLLLENGSTEIEVQKGKMCKGGENNYIKMKYSCAGWKM